MHSQGTMIHLQHMVERACNGYEGEEKEIQDILYDEIYTFVKPIYEDRERSNKITKLILQKYVSKLNGRNVFDVRSDCHLYAIKSMYTTLCKDGVISLSCDEEKHYDVKPVASDDKEFYKVLKSYDMVFESASAYEEAPEEFKKIPKGLILLMELYEYEQYDLGHIAEVLEVEKNVIEYNIGLLRDYILKIGLHPAYDASQDEEDEKASNGEEHHHHHHHHHHTYDEDEDVGIVNTLFPKLSQKVRYIIDVVVAVIVILVGFLLLR